MEETAERESIYNVPPPTVTNIPPNRHTVIKAKLHFSHLGRAARVVQPPLRTSTSACHQCTAMIKHTNAEKAKSRLTISIQSSARRISSHYLLSSLSKAIFVSEYPLISIRGHPQQTHQELPSCTWFPSKSVKCQQKLLMSTFPMSCRGWSICPKWVRVSRPIIVLSKPTRN